MDGGIFVLPAEPGRSAATIDVDITDMGYQLPGQPGTEDITIVVGDTVRWTSRGAMRHSVVSTAGSPDAFDSDGQFPPPARMQNGDEFSHTFSIAGGPY
jgi:plastocyanin